MANLSNINGKFVVEQTTGYVGVGTTDPSYPIEVLNASAEIALNASGGSIYRLKSDSTDSFRINKNGVGDRLVIDGSGNSTFSGTITSGGTIYSTLDSTFSTDGSISKNSVVGLIIRGVTGSVFDLALYGAGGTALMTNPKGTNNIVFNSGNVTIAGTVQVEGSNVTVINASDPVLTVSDTDTNYRGSMRWLSSSNVLEFFTRYAGTYYTNNLVLDRGKVGIGTNSPDDKLDVENGNIRLRSNSDGNTGVLRLFDAAGTESGQIYPAAGDLRFYTPNDIIMSPVGNVGIGTTTPAYKTSVFKGGDYNGSEILLDLSIKDTVGGSYNANTGAGISFSSSHWSVSPTEKVMGAIYGANTDGGTAANGYLSLRTRTSDSVTEKMRIRNTGSIFMSHEAFAGIVTGLQLMNPVNAAGTGHGTSILLHCTNGDPNRGVKIASSSTSNYAIDNDMLFYTSAGSTLTEKMRIRSGGGVNIGSTGNFSAGKLVVQQSGGENGGIVTLQNGGTYGYYTRVCHNATGVSQAGYWHIKTNIPVGNNIMFMAKFYGYIYGSAQVLDLTHVGYAYSGTNTVINQGVQNNGNNVNSSSAIYTSANGGKVTFRIAFGAGATFSTYFAGVYMDMAFPSPAGQGHDFLIEAQSFSQSTTVY